MSICKILLIDQENTTREMVDLALSSLDIKYRQTNVSDYAEAETLLGQIFFDLIIAGHLPDDQNPLAIFQLTGKFNRQGPVIALSSRPDPHQAIEFFRAGAQDYLLKPCLVDELATRLGNHLNKPTAKQRKLPARDTTTKGGRPVTDIELTMAHDIRALLLSMLVLLKHLGLGRFGGMAPKVAYEIDVLAERFYKLLDITDEYLADIRKKPTPLDTARHHPQDLLNDIIAPVLAELADDIKENNIVLDKIPNEAGQEKPIRINANVVELKAVFRNLFNNAIKHGGKGCTVGLDIRTHRNYYLFSIFNSGSAIPEIDRHKLFTIDNKRINDSRYGGAGIGLYLTKKIIHRYGGKIWYDTIKDRAHFFFTIPQSKKLYLHHGSGVPDNQYFAQFGSLTDFPHLNSAAKR